MMRSVYLFVMMLMLVAVPAGNAAFAKTARADDTDIVGYWLTKKKDVVVRIDACGRDRTQRCGWIYWLDPQVEQIDSKNPDPALRGQPLCGVRVLYDLKPDQDNVWRDGLIYKADDGKIFRAKLKQVDAERIDLRGYLGFPALGKTTYLTRVSKEGYTGCDERVIAAQRALDRTFERNLEPVDDNEPSPPPRIETEHVQKKPKSARHSDYRFNR